MNIVTDVRLDNGRGDDAGISYHPDIIARGKVNYCITSTHV